MIRHARADAPGLAEPVLLADTTPVARRATDITRPTSAGVLEHVGRITAVTQGLHVAVGARWCCGGGGGGDGGACGR